MHVANLGESISYSINQELLTLSARLKGAKSPQKQHDSIYENIIRFYMH